MNLPGKTRRELKMVQRASIGESIMDSSKKQGLQQGFSGKKKKKKKRYL